MEVPPLPLVDRRAGVALRAWRAEDAAALAAAWADPQVAGAERIGRATSETVAVRWIGGWEARWAADLALDLVVGPIDGDELWGEVGMSRRRWRPRLEEGPGSGGAPVRGSADEAVPAERVVWEAGWWLTPAHRGRGVTVPAMALLLTWFDRVVEGEPVVARIHPANAASARVAERIGMTRRGRLDAEHDLWVLPAGAASRVPGRRLGGAS